MRTTTLHNTNYERDLHNYAFWGMIQDLELTLASKQDAINFKDENGFTPLHYATNAFLDQVMVVDLLVRSGADINIESNRGKTPLDLAISKNHLQIIQYLQSLGAKVNSM